MRDVWIDTDMGFDDLAAICMLSDRVAGLSIVAGNVPLTQAVRNALGACETFGWSVPVHAGADAPVACALVTADYVLGADGMAGRGRKLPASPRAVDSENAIAALADWMDSGGVQVLALGPLTNIAHLLRARPDLAQRMALTWMGGAVSGGNHTAAAEFNAFVDPEALGIVIGAGVAVTMVGLDCCRQVRVTAADVAPVRAMAGERAQLLADLLEGYVGISSTGTMALYDPVAAACVMDPASVTLRAGRLDVELQGTLTRGMTVVEWRDTRAAPNARVAVAADAAKVRSLFLGGLMGMAR